jgi:hypothetical protein
MTISRFSLLVAFSVLLCGCTDTDFKLDCKIPRDAAGNVVVSVAEFKEITELLISEIDLLKTELENDASLVGFSGSIARQFAGTESYSFALRMNTLRSAVARQKARELAMMNDGDTLLGTSQHWQCETFANSVASLDVGQSQKQLLENMEAIKVQFERFGNIMDNGAEGSEN